MVEGPRPGLILPKAAQAGDRCNKVSRCRSSSMAIAQTTSQNGSMSGALCAVQLKAGFSMVSSSVFEARPIRAFLTAARRNRGRLRAPPCDRPKDVNRHGKVGRNEEEEPPPACAAGDPDT